jgi:hypothetical protein
MKLIKGSKRLMKISRTINIDYSSFRSHIKEVNGWVAA